MFYLSTETIEKAYNALTSVELDDQGANAMFYFLILMYNLFSFQYF